jgi:hypothetical protein
VGGLVYTIGCGPGAGLFHVDFKVDFLSVAGAGCVRMSVKMNEWLSLETKIISEISNYSMIAV